MCMMRNKESCFPDWLFLFAGSGWAANEEKQMGCNQYLLIELMI